MGDERDAVLALATRFQEASEAGDVETLRSVYAPDAVVWHNVDAREQSVDEVLAMTPWIREHLRGLRHVDVRRHRTDHGYVQQHVLRATTPSDAELAVPACIVVEVRDGLVTRLDEYLDTAAFAVLRTEDLRGA
jgi:ketosteroid isomerase-like protein